MSHKAKTRLAFIMECPVCNELVPEEQFLLHAMMQHPQFFAVWASFSLPTLTPHIDAFLNNQDTHEHWLMEDEEEAATYEDLLQLCEQIGYHKVGVKNIDEVAPIVKEPQPSEWVCAICLEHECSCEGYLRRLRVCEHVFCGVCIENWFKENKTCPVCKQYVEPEPKPVPTMDDVD